MKIKKGDIVSIRAGKDRGREGKVLRVLPKSDQVVVEGIHMVKKREKARQSGKKGQTVDRPLPFHSSNVLIICSSCKKATRIGTDTSGERNVRVCKKCKTAL